MSARSHYIKNIDENGVVKRRKESGFREKLQKCISSWNDLLKQNEVSVALGAIHFFWKANLDLYWQRHEIATAYAALGGGAFGAAHFSVAFEDPTQSTLAAAGVPGSHLEAGPLRKAHRMMPCDSFKLDDALVRAFARTRTSARSTHE